MASAEAACGGSIPGPGGRRETDTQSAIMQVRAIRLQEAHALLHNMPPRVHLLHPTNSDFLQAFWRLQSTLARLANARLMPWA